MKIVFCGTPQFAVPTLEALVAAGAAFVGGCCGTTPTHIRAFAEAIEGVTLASLHEGFAPIARVMGVSINGMCAWLPLKLVQGRIAKLGEA